MNPELEERIARIADRMVLRNVAKDEVFEKLTVNGITGGAALVMYQNACRARTKAIRIKLSKKALCSLPWLLAVMAFIQLEWAILGRESEFDIFLFAGSFIVNPFFVPTFIGLWKIINSLLWAIFAPFKKGSFDDDEA